MYKVIQLVLSPFMPKRTEIAFPVLTKAFLQPSSDTVSLFYLLTSPLVTQNPSPKDIARNDITSPIMSFEVIAQERETSL